MSGNNYIMSFDFGTSGVKAILVDFDMNFVADSDHGYPLNTPQVGYAEQDPNDYWKATCYAARNVMKIGGVPKEDVKGISFGTQGMGIIPVDKEGKILYNNISWVDSRAGKQAERLNNLIGKEVQNANDVVSKLLWLRENETEIYNKTKYFLDCTGYLVYKMTGNPYMELTNSSPYSLDPRHREFKEHLYGTAGIDLNKMPPLKFCTEYAGNLTSNAAEELGLTTQAAVFMGTGDVPAAAAGCGCCKEGDAHIYIGSSAWLSVLKDNTRIQDPSPGIYQMYSINKDLYVYGGCVQSACMTFNWAIEQFYKMESMIIKGNLFEFLEQGDVFKYIEQEIADIEPGSGNMLATPWLYGEHCPVLDEKARAVFLNVTNLQDRRYFINAIMEGICYSLRGQIEYYTIDTGKTLSMVGVVGGGALSDHWMQMMADILALPVYCPANTRHAGAIGAAVAAGVGLGLYKIDQIKDLIKVERTFYPRKENAATYDKLYRIFSKVYPALKDLFSELNQ